LISLDGCLVTYGFAAFIASMNDDKSLFGVRKSLNRAENPAAVVSSVAGVNIYVERAKAEWTMIPRRVAEWKHLAAAVFADKALVVLLETLVFHLPLLICLRRILRIYH